MPFVRSLRGRQTIQTSKAIMTKSEVVRQYFGSWISKDRRIVDMHFADAVTYIESYGPIYEGLAQVQQWFDDWNSKGSVLEWRIDKMSALENSCFVEWFFRCDYEGSIGYFDGVSIIEFDGDNKIVLIKEYQSKHEHHFPYPNPVVDENQGATSLAVGASL